jgi:hypothetical protein
MTPDDEEYGRDSNMDNGVLSDGGEDDIGLANAKMMLGTSCFKADKFSELFEESKERQERKNMVLLSKDCTF